jgi:hypothetical protein
MRADHASSTASRTTGTHAAAAGPPAAAEIRQDWTEFYAGGAATGQTALVIEVIHAAERTRSSAACTSR